MPGISVSKIPIPFRGAGGISWQTYWATLISATVENAAPTHVVLTFPTAQTSLGASDFTIAGFTISSASWADAVLTLVLSYGVTYYSGNLTITFVKTGETAIVTNNVAITDTVGWYVAGDGSATYVTKDANDLVSVWKDLSGNDNHLTQATGSKQPSYSEAGILFVNDSLKSPAFTYNAPQMVYGVFTVKSYRQYQTIINGLNDAFRIRTNADDKFTFENIIADFNIGTEYIFRLLTNGASSFCKINEVSTTGTNTNDDIGGITLGNTWTDSGVYSNVEFKELIFRTATDSAAIELSIYNYLANKYGLTPIQIASVYLHNEASTIYVSPDGLGDGSTEENATELQSAIVDSNVLAGDTIILLDGIYEGNYMATIKGTAENRVVIKSKTPYQAVIDGGLTLGNNDGVTGAYIDVKNIHITNLDADRGTWENENNEVTIPTQLFVLAPNCRIINNYIHDGGVGLSAYDKSEGLIAYGNLIWNSGWADNVRGGAQNLYSHGANQTIKSNICAGGFKETFKAYSAGSYIRDYLAQNNVMFVRSTDVIGSETMRMSNISFIGNHVLQNLIAIGYVFDQNDNAIIEDNITYTPLDIDGSLNALYFEKLSYRRNKIVGIRTWFKDPTDTVLKDWDVDDNEYHEVGDLPDYDLEDFVSRYDLGWLSEGYDLNSTFDHLMPTENQTFVYPNEYYEAGDTRIGIVVIWNWLGNETVEVDLTDLGLEVGQTYRWRQAQDPLVDIDTWECAGNSYTFAMTGHTVALPIGFDEELIPTQFPTFGCFIIEKV